VKQTISPTDSAAPRFFSSLHLTVLYVLIGDPFASLTPWSLQGSRLRRARALRCAQARLSARGSTNHQLATSTNPR